MRHIFLILLLPLLLWGCAANTTEEPATMPETVPPVECETTLPPEARPVDPMQMLLDAMREDCDSFAELFANFQRILRKAVAEKLRDQNKYQLERSRNGKEVMRVSCLVDDCLKRGRSVDQGGAVYNQIQPNFLGLANVADSLLVLDTLIFKTGEYSLQEFQCLP